MEKLKFSIFFIVLTATNPLFMGALLLWCFKIVFDINRTSDADILILVPMIFYFFLWHKVACLFPNQMAMLSRVLSPRMSKSKI